jgi:chemotaxis signal transduction protein
MTQRPEDRYEAHSTASSTRFVRCAAGGDAFCLPLGEVAALRGREHFVADRQPGRFAGRVETGSGAVPALALADVLGLGPAAPAAVFLLLGQGAERWALGVDRVSRPFTAPTAHGALPLLEGRAVSPFFSGAAWDGERPLLVLRPQGLNRRPEASGDQAAAPRPAGEAAAERRADGGTDGNGGPGAAAAPGGRERLLLFSTRPQASAWLFGLCPFQVDEVLRSVTVWPLPGAPPHVRGITARNRRPLLVLDLGHRLGTAAAPSSDPHRLLLVRSPDGTARAGLAAATDVKLRELPSNQRATAAPTSLDRTLTRAIFDLDDRTLVIPHIGRLIQSPAGPDQPSTPSQWAFARKGHTS